MEQKQKEEAEAAKTAKEKAVCACPHTQAGPERPSMRPKSEIRQLVKEFQGEQLVWTLEEVEQLRTTYKK